MYLKQIAIENYKSFFKSQEIIFSPSFNVVVGANNAGKTAFVEALSLKIENKPHISQETIHSKGESVENRASVIQANWSLSIDELRHYLWNNSPTFLIQKEREETREKVMERVQNAFSNSEVNLKCRYESSSLTSAKITEMDSMKVQDLGVELVLKRPDVFPNTISHNVSVRSVQDFVAYKLANYLVSKINFFRAERVIVGQFRSGTNPNLESDAKNLAQVLNYLQTSNSAKFERLIEFTKSIFPDIKHFAVPPVDDANTVRIQLWYVDKSTEREDLAVPLQESGTGIGQILSILYAAIISDTPHPIVIDEPQSFLHPKAIRKLFGILRQNFPEHQYIVTTHSPLTVSAANPDNLILLQKEKAVTKARTIIASEKDELQLLLTEVGARFSDVFGSENILWVEGITEESSFPLIVSKLLNKQLMGTTILGIVNVGDLEGRHKELTLRIYKKLSAGHSLVPPALGFILDKEGRSEIQQNSLERESQGLIYFTPRRMYENYLINSEAIAAVISELENFSDQPVTKEEIENWIKENRQEFSATPDVENWIVDVHGAKLLQKLFTSLSETRYSYDKVRDGIKLTNWLINNNPEELKDIADLLEEILNTQQGK